MSLFLAVKPPSQREPKPAVDYTPTASALGAVLQEQRELGEVNRRIEELTTLVDRLRGQTALK